jgi:aminocarboxymuconate-semialdehyde decarboxylase
MWAPSPPSRARSLRAPSKGSDSMTESWNRYGLTAARTHRVIGRARRPTTTTIDAHCHVAVPEAGKFAAPHVDVTKIPLGFFADDATRAVNALQEADVGDVLYRDLESRLRTMDEMGVDMQVVAPAPNQCYYTLDPEVAGTAHRMVNEGIAAFLARRPDRFAGLGTVTLQEPARAVAELDMIMGEYGLKGAQILASVNGQELADPRFHPFFARAEKLGAFLMMHPNGFTEGKRFTHYYFSNVIGNPLETAVALHNLIFSGTLAKFPDLKLMAVHGGGFLPSYSGRIDHAWGARSDCHADLPLPPSTYLRQVYFDTVVFSTHQLAYLLELFGSDRILMGTDYPFDMGEYDPIGHIAEVPGMDMATLVALTGGNARRALGL